MGGGGRATQNFFTDFESSVLRPGSTGKKAQNKTKMETTPKIQLSWNWSKPALFIPVVTEYTWYIIGGGGCNGHSLTFNPDNSQKKMVSLWRSTFAQAFWGLK